MIQQAEIDVAVAVALAVRPREEIGRYGIVGPDMAKTLRPEAERHAGQRGFSVPELIVTAMVRGVMIGMELERLTAGEVVVLGGSGSDAAKLAAYTGARGWKLGEDPA